MVLGGRYFWKRRGCCRGRFRFWGGFICMRWLTWRWYWRKWNDLPPLAIMFNLRSANHEFNFTKPNEAWDKELRPLDPRWLLRGAVAGLSGAGGWRTSDLKRVTDPNHLRVLQSSSVISPAVFRWSVSTWLAAETAKSANEIKMLSFWSWFTGATCWPAQRGSPECWISNLTFLSMQLQLDCKGVRNES